MFSDNAGYYSEDFARHIDRKNKLMLQWCYNCNYVIVFRQVKMLGIFPLPYLTPKEELPLSELSSHEIAKTEDLEIGGMAISNLLRPVWWAFLCRAKLSVSEEDAPAIALREMIERLPVPEAVLCLVVTSEAHLALPLEVQLEQGKYLKEHRSPDTVLNEFLGEVEKIGTEKADAVLSMIKEFKK